eukprot:Tamp_06542.p1 GENE.Tamp_06542~~Tamp_06542.p1  ORF type:complete len:298 (+),score=55.52 Tamp_06542:593-1486(+)
MQRALSLLPAALTDAACKDGNPVEDLRVSPSHQCCRLVFTKVELRNAHSAPLTVSEARTLQTQTGAEKSAFWRVMWLLFFPLILLWHSIRIYFLPCLQVYADRFFGTLCLSLGQTLCCMCTCKCWRQQEKCFLCEYEDPDFPPDAKSLGQWKDKSPEQLKEIQWKRAAKLGSEPAQLFQGGIQPGDIAQGQLGDCWLMAALACLAEHPAAIQRCFLTRERSVRGCYRIQLYDGQKKEFVKLSIDDYLPTDNGRPLFAKPNGSELWVLLLEKAFAKAEFLKKKSLRRALCRRSEIGIF